MSLAFSCDYGHGWLPLFQSSDSRVILIEPVEKYQFWNEELSNELGLFSVVLKCKGSLLFVKKSITILFCNFLLKRCELSYNVFLFVCLVNMKCNILERRQAPPSFEFGHSLHIKQYLFDKFVSI